MNHDITPIAHPVSAACARLGIGRTFLYELIKRGQLRTIKLGHKTLVPESELQRLVAERLQSAA